jgi:3-hydroxybutyryl-CoA dehydratase
MTYYFDELKPGLAERFVKTVAEADIAAFGEVSGDRNPVHFDQAYAETTLFKGRVAHGMLTASFLSTVLGTKIPGPGTVFLSLNVAFKAPVRIGETVTATCTVAEILPKRRVKFACVCTVGDVVVVEGEALVMAPLRPKAK